MRFKKHRLWLWSVLALCLIVILLAIPISYVRNLAPGRGSKRAGIAAAARGPGPELYTIRLSNFRFDPKSLEVSLGAGVTWIDQEGRHQIEADDDTFESPILSPGEHFTYRFDQFGTFRYHCDFHGEPGGKGMAGIIRVTLSVR